MITGLAGLVGAGFTGLGEFLLHFDPLTRFEVEYAFFQGISAQRSNAGHFFGVLAAPLYVIGFWHVRLMLKPASDRWSLAAFFLTSYGCIIGIVWIGSRASISALVNMPPETDVSHLIALYDFRYETLLQITRIAVLILSIIFVALVVRGRSHYPRWMAVLNPFLLIIASFVVFLLAPDIGKYLMPIALNVAFVIFFSASLLIARGREF